MGNALWVVLGCRPDLLRGAAPEPCKGFHPQPPWRGDQSPGNSHSRTASGAPCDFRRSARLHRPLGAASFGPPDPFFASRLRPVSFRKLNHLCFFRAVNPEHLSAFGAFSWGICAVFCANRRLKGRKVKYCRIFSLSPIFFYVIMTAGCADFCTLSMFVRRPCGRNQHIHFRRVINLCL